MIDDLPAATLFRVRFTKMHGLGNDYLYLDAFAEPDLAALPDLHGLTRAMCNRHRGVGADGLIVLSPPHDPADADFRMRMFNADGLDGGICGNGTRCAVKLVLDRGRISPKPDRPLIIDAGPRRLRASAEYGRDGRVSQVTIGMGAPVFDLDRIPVDPTLIREIRPADAGRPPLYKVDHRTACFVSVGNPHMVVFLEESVDLVNLHDDGPKFERHPAFPQRMNYHIVNIKGRRTIAMRTWERGTGATQACASGAVATVAAGAALGELDDDVLVAMPGGSLSVSWDRAINELSMTGEAVEVFSGEWNP